ncbi:MAG: single-strand DNA-binding protein [Eubacteriales bacterium]|nr:single-strand DNA-binding protein [Eubacteriales bacterium]
MEKISRGGGSMLNRIILIGRLTRDPELRYTPQGRPVSSFTLAVDRPFRNQQGERETDFIPIVVWGPQAENCAQYLKKGKLAAVEGRLQVRSFEGNDGIRRKVAEVVAENVRFLSPREDSLATVPDVEDFGTAVDFDSDDEVPF